MADVETRPYLPMLFNGTAGSIKQLSRYEPQRKEAAMLFTDMLVPIFLWRTPILPVARHATRQDRCTPSGLIISMKLSGKAIVFSISRQAPVSETLRTMHSRPVANLNEIDPPLNVRLRLLLRGSPWSTYTCTPLNSRKMQ